MKHLVRVLAATVALVTVGLVGSAAGAHAVQNRPPAWCAPQSVDGSCLPIQPTA